MGQHGVHMGFVFDCQLQRPGQRRTFERNFLKLNFKTPKRLQDTDVSFTKAAISRAHANRAVPLPVEKVDVHLYGLVDETSL